MTIPLLPQLPGWTYPIKRSPEVQGLDLQAISGRRNWYPNFVWPLYHYELTYSVLRGAAAYTEWQQLMGFFNSVKTTPGGYFYFDDPDDDTVLNQNIGTGNGSNRVFQPIRSQGGFVEPILGAQNSGATFQVNGTTAAATIDPATGLVTFTSAPGNGLPVTWSGTYYQVCQFEDQTIDFSKFMATFYEMKSLKFCTVRY